MPRSKNIFFSGSIQGFNPLIGSIFYMEKTAEPLSGLPCNYFYLGDSGEVPSR